MPGSTWTGSGSASASHAIARGVRRRSRSLRRRVARAPRSRGAIGSSCPRWSSSAPTASVHGVYGPSDYGTLAGRGGGRRRGGWSRPVALLRSRTALRRFRVDGHRRGRRRVRPARAARAGRAVAARAEWRVKPGPVSARPPVDAGVRLRARSQRAGGEGASGARAGARSAPPKRSGRARRAAASCRARAPGSAGSSRASIRTRPARRPRTAPPRPPATLARAAARPSAAVAPAMIGSAACRDSRLASTRVNRRHRAAASVAPLRDTPGISEQACATPSHSASAVPASSAPRSWGARSASAMASAPATRPAATVGGVPKCRSIGRSNR